MFSVELSKTKVWMNRDKWMTFRKINDYNEPCFAVQRDLWGSVSERFQAKRDAYDTRRELDLNGYKTIKYKLKLSCRCCRINIFTTTRNLTFVFYIICNQSILRMCRSFCAIYWLLPDFDMQNRVDLIKIRMWLYTRYTCRICA